MHTSLWYILIPANYISLTLQVPVDEFSHLLKGLRSGCPPHGGIALGTYSSILKSLCMVMRITILLDLRRTCHINIRTYIINVCGLAM